MSEKIKVVEGAVGDDTIHEMPKGLNGPAGPTTMCDLEADTYETSPSSNHAWYIWHMSPPIVPGPKPEIHYWYHAYPVVTHKR
jgi:hypothetical protein